jgi:tetratricopeptide (TPR) repeat protein
MSSSGRLRGVRWSLSTDAPAELFTELSLAREAIAKGKYVKAKRIVANVLNRVSDGSASKEDRAVFASARAILGMAEQRLDNMEAAAAHLAAAATTFQTLLGEGYELDTPGRVDYIQSVILTGQATSGFAFVTRALEAGTEIPSSVVLELAAALHAEKAVAEMIDLLTLAHRREPEDVSIAVELALALEQNEPSGDAGLAHLDAAVLLTHEGDYARAEEHFRRSLAMLPQSAGATVGLAQVLLAQDRPGEAIKVIQESAERYPRTPEIVAIWSQALAQAGDMDAAIEAARQGIVNFGETRPLTDTLVRLLLTAGLADQAAGLVQRALQEDPGDPEMLLAQADVLLGQGNALEAVATLQPLVAEFPESLELWLALVNALAAAERMNDAADTLSRALTVHPDDTDLLQQKDDLIATCLDFAEQNLNELPASKIQQVLEVVLSLDDDNAYAHALLGELLRRQDELPAALDHLNRAVKVLPNSGWVVGTRGQVLAALGRSEAIDELRRAAELDDSLTWVHVEIGDAYRLAGRYNEALLELTRATEMEPANAWAWATRGATEQLSGQWEQARTSLETAIRLAPDYAWALAVKANLLRDIDELDTALEVLHRSLELDSENSWAWGLKAWVLNTLDGDPAEEEAAARSAIELAPTDIYLHLCLGEALIRQGRDQAANREFHTGIDLAATQQPLNPETIANVAWCNLRLGDYPEALSLFTTFVARDYSNIPVQFELGLTLLCAGRPAVALDQYESAAAMVSAKGHVGRRRSVTRVARHDLHALMHRGQIKNADDVQQIEQILDRIPVDEKEVEAQR